MLEIKYIASPKACSVFVNRVLIFSVFCLCTHHVSYTSEVIFTIYGLCSWSNHELFQPPSLPMLLSLFGILPYQAKLRNHETKLQ